MPTIYDNQEIIFLSGLSEALEKSYRSDISAAYFNLRGWKKIASSINKYKGGEEHQCRLLLGMYGQGYHFKQELRKEGEVLFKADNSKARKLKADTIKNFRNQLMTGYPSNEDEKGLRNLVRQLKEKKVIIKCFTRHPLHAKLYLTFNEKDYAGKIGFVGSSNLTLAGLERQGELNIDVLDQQSCDSLSKWFEGKWNDQFSLDISEEIIKLIEESWARESLIKPYHIYMKMAYHLSEDARKGLTDFFIPKELKDTLFEFQSAAVRIATHHVVHKNGVLIGDVVGLGKTLMAIAVAKILEEENGWQTLILCPKNLETMWEEHRQEWVLSGKVIPISQVQKKLPELKRHHIVIIDESHNLRNPQGKRYQVIRDYISQNDSKCILLSATPYNKTYKDLSSQLGLFVDPDANLGVRPNRFLKEVENFEGLTSTLRAFEKSNYSEDWQQLMAQFLVRRTRSFIKENYGRENAEGRCYIETSSGDKRFFPDRVAKTVKYDIDEQYQKLFSQEVVDIINNLNLARYDLFSYKKENLPDLSKEENKLFQDLEQSRAHPKGFCRINLFKRLESSGYSFLQSIQRHILRNCIFIYAIKNQEDLIVRDKSSDIVADAFNDSEGGITGFLEEDEDKAYFLTDFDSFYQKAKESYKKYKEKNSGSIRWISSTYFNDKLLEDLEKDTEQFISLLRNSEEWNPEADLKLKKLETLLKKENKKVIVFTQSRETAQYLESQLNKRGLKKLELITGGMDNIQPTIKRFSPKSNKSSLNEPEIDILITTDVLSEGQNLQDCNIIINYDLPWAIIKLIQRVGRVDRIGQLADKIFCYSFMPNEGLDKLINLKHRIQNRLRENAEVIGTDEKFFENEKQILTDLYSEKSQVLEKEILEDIDLSSFALEIWNKGIKKDASLEEKIKNMPNMVHSSKSIKESNQSESVLLFAKSHVNNFLLQLNDKGESLAEDQMKILETAKCEPETESLKRTESHYEIVEKGLSIIQKSNEKTGMKGNFGTSRNPRAKLFKVLENLPEGTRDATEQLMDDVYNYPLTNDAENTLKRMFRQKISDNEILKVSLERNKNGILLNKKETMKMNEKPRIVCSMGLIKK